VTAYRVFLSHSGADAAWVKYIAQHAQAIGVQPYLFEHDPQPGRSVSSKVKQAIEAADAVVVLLTGNSRASTYVQQEIGYAEAKGKLIVPLLQAGLGGTGMAMLEGRGYIQFDFSNPGPGLQTLMNYLAKLKGMKEEQRATLAAFGLLILVGWLASKS